MLPPNERVGGVAPGLRLLTAGVAAEILRVLHLGENVERGSIVRVRDLTVPSLAPETLLGHAHVALIETSATLDARTCNASISQYHSENQYNQSIIIINNMDGIYAMEESMQDMEGNALVTWAGTTWVRRAWEQTGAVPCGRGR